MKALIFRVVLVVALISVPAWTGIETVTAGYQSSLLRLHNDVRKKRNLPRLRRNAALIRAAKNYAGVMRANNHFSHTGLDNSTSHDRILAAGFAGKTTGENIAFGYTKPKLVFKGWMRSPGHRANIMNKSFNRVGFGKSGTYWVTNFGG